MEIKISKLFVGCLVGCGIAAATGCSDFSDYNDSPADATLSGNLTLWENVMQNPQLTDFAALVERTGFDTQLQAARAYTVWAPLNGTFDAAAYQALDDSTLLQQFIKGHTAQYSHVASGGISERVHMLNGKSFDFDGNGTYTFGGVRVDTPNVPGTNGVMHLLNGAAPFYYNIYEYIMANKADTLFRDYFKSYELTELDLDNSVEGPVVNGMQTYVDSVLVTSNSLLRTLGASLSNEDSTYTFLLPDDKAYQDMYDRVKPTYNFINTTVVQDVESAGSAGTKSITVNAAHLSDSLVRRTILRNLAFSNNDAYNRWLVDKGENTDTIRSTNRAKFSNPGEILSHTVDKVTMSNGYVHIMDTLAFRPWETYLPEIAVNPLYYLYNDDMRNKYKFAIRLESVEDPKGLVFGPEYTKFNYLRIYPTGDYVKPDVYLQLPSVASATYKFYCVFIPAKVYETEDGVAVDSLELWSEPQPNVLNFTLSYCNESGTKGTYSFSKKFLDSGAKADENPKTLNLNTAFENDPLKTDTVYLGQFTFPVCYRGLGDDYTPNIHISCPISVFNKAQMSKYTRDVRIAGILMKPVELVEFEEQQKK